MDQGLSTSPITSMPLAYIYVNINGNMLYCQCFSEKYFSFLFFHLLFLNLPEHRGCLPCPARLWRPRFSARRGTYSPYRCSAPHPVIFSRRESDSFHSFWDDAFGFQSSPSVLPEYQENPPIPYTLQQQLQFHLSKCRPQPSLPL